MIELLKAFIGVVLTIAAGLLIEELTKWIAWRLKKAVLGVALIITPILTSSPELAVYLTAITKGSHEVAWGSIISQPFMASTMIYPIIVITSITAWALKRRKSPIPIVSRRLAIPLITFALPLAPLLVLNPRGVMTKVYGIALIAAYLVYACLSLGGEESVKAEKVKLRLWNPAIQVIASILTLWLGSHLLVSGIEGLSMRLGLDKVAVTVLITPIATALPESIVGLIFIWRGLDSEGIGVVVGEKALYSTFYLGLALLTGTYIVEEASINAILISIVVSALEALAVSFRRFGVTAPIGLAGYAYYLLSTLRQ